MRRQHLAVRVDVDAGAGGLLEQRLQVGEVVAGDEDRLAGALAERDLRGLGLAEGAGVGGVEDLHRAQVDLAALESDAHPLLETERRVVERDERAEQVRVDLGIGLAERASVVRVGGDALHAVERGLLERLHVGIARGVPRAAELGPKRYLAGNVRAGCRVDHIHATQDPETHGKRVAKLERLVDLGGDRLGAEVDVGECGEQRVLDEVALGGQIGARRRLNGDRGKRAAGVNQQVLERGDVRVLAAGAHLGAAGAVGGLLALVAEHLSQLRGHSFPLVSGAGQVWGAGCAGPARSSAGGEGRAKAPWRVREAAGPRRGLSEHGACAPRGPAAPTRGSAPAGSECTPRCCPRPCGPAAAGRRPPSGRS